MNEIDTVYNNLLFHSGDIAHKDISLFSGCAGDILLLMDLFLHKEEDRFRELISRRVDFIIDCADKISGSSFSSGLCGVLYSLLSVKDIVEVDLPDMEDFDNVIWGQVNLAFCTGNYDLQSGLLGFGLYYLKQAELDERYKDRVRDICRMICNLFIVQQDKITLPYRLEEHPFFVNDALWTNNGFLHGVNSIIAFFLICIHSGVYDPQIIELTLRLLNLEMSLFDEQMMSYPMAYMYGPNDEMILDKRETKLHYCTGDFGIILNFKNAYSILGDPSYLRTAKESYKRIIRRLQKGETTGALCFCHGKATLVYFTERLRTLLDNSAYSCERELFEITNALTTTTGDTSILNGDNGISMTLLSKHMNSSLERVLLLR